VTAAEGCGFGSVLAAWSAVAASSCLGEIDEHVDATMRVARAEPLEGRIGSRMVSQAEQQGALEAAALVHRPHRAVHRGERDGPKVCDRIAQCGEPFVWRRECEDRVEPVGYVAQLVVVDVRCVEVVGV
jgi:hypothetical protein